MALRGKATPGHYDLSTLLRPVEKVTVSIPCRIRTDGLEYHKAEAGVVVHPSNTDEAARVDRKLMVVVPSSDSSNIRITHLVPLTASFRHSLNQTPPSPSTSFFHQSSRPHITLSLWDESHKVELRISSALTVQVQSFIAELKRLVQLSNKLRPDQSCLFSWTGFYPVEPPHFGAGDFSDDEDDAGTPAASSSSTAVSPSLSTTTLQTPLSALTLGSGAESDKKDEQYPNPFSPTFSRTAFLRKRLFARQDKWSTRTELKIRLATYNVNDKLPPPGTTELVPLVGSGDDDLLVFGFQEVDLRSQALLVSQGNVRAEEWEGAIFRALKERAGEFERIAMTQYVGVVTVVLAKKAVREHITRVETSEKGIGLLGFGGNKAGICVRLQYHDTTICFVNSHLAAFASALERRRSDYQVLLRGLTFPVPTGEQIIPAHEEFLPEMKDRLIGVEDCHVLFWQGDLNYRVDVADDILRTWVDEQRWNLVLEKDQLLADIASGKSFAGYKEPTIDFPPSYKYVHGSSTLDARRSPAYTDRILHTLPGPSTKHSPPTPISCASYTSHEIFWSDHRPVSASYTVQVRVADQDKKREEYVAVERELEKLEEVYRPSLEVIGTNVEFGDVQLGVPVVREVILKNNGKVPASFAFKPPAQGKPICKAAIWPTPSFGIKQPEGQVVLKISVNVDEDWSKRLTLGEEDLNDVLVLRVAEGKDTFVTIQATYQPSILGLPLQLLASFTKHIRSTSLHKRKELLSGQGQPHQGSRGQKPVSEIWRLLEHLMAHAPYTDDPWSSQVPRGSILAVLDNLDTGTDLVDGDSKVVARTIVFLLGHLPESLVGVRSKECEAVTDRDDAFAALEGLEQVNTNILIGLMSVVRLCAGVEQTPAAADSTAVSPPTGAATPASTGENDAPEGASSTDEGSDAVDDLAVPSEMVEIKIEAPDPTPPALPPKAEQQKTPIIEATIEALVPAVFGFAEGNAEGRKRFIRCMLEG